MTETWKEIPGFSGLYEVSNLGRVRSVDAIITVERPNGTVYQRVRRGRVLRQRLHQANSSRHGYRLVSICKEGVYTHATVHTFVAAAFLGERPEGMYVCHKDGNGQNNALGNLYYGTPKQNCEDADRHGTRARGETLGHAKLTEVQVAEIRAARGVLTQRQLAAKYGVRQTAICKIQNGQRWRHIESPPDEVGV